MKMHSPIRVVECAFEGKLYKARERNGDVLSIRALAPLKDGGFRQIAVTGEEFVRLSAVFRAHALPQKSG